MISLKKLFRNMFQGHRGRPGRVGASLPVSISHYSDNPTRKPSPRESRSEQDSMFEKLQGKEDSGLSGIDMVGSHLDYSQLGERGMFPVSGKFPLGKRGDEVDYYNSSGNKHSGIIKKIDAESITIMDTESREIVTQILVDERTGAPMTAKRLFDISRNRK
jgi:hypothetical protein